MDDYELLFDSRNAAEEALGTLERIARTFELSLNPLKTEIIELPTVLEPAWRTGLHQFKIRESGRPSTTQADLVSFFSLAFDLQQQYPHESVLRYALRKASSSAGDSNVFRTFEGLALSCIAADPSTIDAAFLPLVIGHAQGTKPPLQALGDALLRTVEEHAGRDHSNETLWAMWTMCVLGVPISDDICQLLAQTQDDFVALMYLMMADLGLATRHHLALFDDIDNTADPHLAEHWLIAYEATRRGWHSCPDLQADPVFSAMLAAEVRFIDDLSVPTWIGQCKTASEFERISRKFLRTARALASGGHVPIQPELDEVDEVIEVLETSEIEEWPDVDEIEDHGEIDNSEIDGTHDGDDESDDEGEGEGEGEDEDEDEDEDEPEDEDEDEHEDEDEDGFPTLRWLDLAGASLHY